MGKEIDFIIMCRAHWQNSSLYQRVLLVSYYQACTRSCCYWVFCFIPLSVPTLLPSLAVGTTSLLPRPSSSRGLSRGTWAESALPWREGQVFRLWRWPPAPCPRRCSWGLINIKDYKRGSAGCIQEAPGTESNIQAAAFAGLASWIAHSAGPSGPWAI